MSCSNCGSKTAGCGCTDTAYTTPKVYTCPPDTSCPQPVRCSEFMDAACIFLNDGIADAGIQPGSSLESIVQQLILLVTNPGCVDAPGGVPGGGTVNFVDAVWPGNAITIAGGPITNSGTFVFNGNGTSLQYIDGQGNLQTFPSIGSPVEFQTNGTPNSSQTLLNLVAGTGVTLTESGGSVTIDVDANVYTVDNGLSPDPTDANNFQLGSQTAPGAPLIHDTYIAGSQYRFEINNTNSMFLQGNRVDIEGAAAGAMMLSTGGAADSSVEVTGVEVAIESTASANTTKIFLDPTKIRIQTPLYNVKNNNDVLTLIDKTTGEVEYMPVGTILLQTDGTDNGDQTLLNLISGNGITLTNVGGDVTIDGPLFQTDGTDNTVQTLLNLVAGTGITLTESAGSVTIDAAAPAINLTTNNTGGPSTYNPLTGDLNIPIYNYQIDVQEEGSSVVINPLVLNFIGTAVTVTSSLGGTAADITITGAEYNGNEGIWKETSSLPETFMLGAPLGSGNTIPFTESREVDTDAYNLTFTGSANADFTLYTYNTAGAALGGGAIYAQASSANQTGVYASAPLGIGLNVYAGLYGIVAFTNNSDYNTILNVNPISTTNISTILDLNRNNANTAGAGLQIINKINQTPSSGLVTTAQAYGVGDTVTESNFELQTLGINPILTTNFTVKGIDGEIQFNQYGLGTFSNTAAYILGVDASGNVVETTIGGLTITVDGNSFSSSTVIDFVTSADIIPQDLGGGVLSFVLANPPVTYDSNEGVYNDSNVFKLGSPSYAEAASVSEKFLENRYIYTDTNSLQILGVKTEEAPTYVVNIVNEYTGDGGTALQLDHYGSGAGLAVFQDKAASANTGMSGIYIQASDQPAAPLALKYTTGINIYDSIGNDEYRGLRIYSASTNTLPIYITRTEVSGTIPNTIERFMLLERMGTSANGIGGSIDFSIIASTGIAQTSNKLISKWFDNTNVSRKSQFEIQGTNSGTVQTQFTILGGGTAGPGGAWSLISGQIKFNRYAAGAIYKSATDLSTNSGFNLGIDADGNIWATDFSTGTGGTGVQDISIGTLTNGASATVSNPTGPSATINITGQNAYTQIAADAGTASANAYNSLFSVIGANGISTSVSNGTMPVSDIITVTGPNKYLNFVTKNISGTTIATYTPAIWNETLNIQAGSGITITNGGSPNTIIISGGAGTGTVSNVTGVNANGFTVGITNGTTTPAITVGTSITGVLVGNGTSVSAVTGTGVMVFSGTGYTFQALPTVNDGAIAIGANTTGLTNTSIVLANSAGGAFTANKATSSTYRLEIGPAIANLVTLMTAAMPVNPAVSAGATTLLPPYIVKTGQDTYTVQTPVTTFSPGSTGFTVTSLVSSATTTAINGAVVLGGALNVTSGGTGLTTAPGEGQILIGNSTGGFNIGNVSAGTGITVSSSGTGIQISATGITPGVLNGLHIHSLDGSIRLGSGTPADGDTIRPLVERTDIRMGNQIYRLSNANQGYISEIGFQIDDSVGQKIGYFGSSTSTSVTTANPPQAGFIFSGAGGTPLTTYNGVYIDNTTTEIKLYSGFSGGARQIVYRSATLANNKITQVGTWGVTTDSVFYEAVPSVRTIQIGSIAGNNNWIKLDDANQRVDINKSTIYASGYGTGAVTSGTGLTYLIGTDVGGKFFEFAGRSISQITGNTGTFSAASMASATAAVPFSIQGTGTISTSIAGNVLTITNSATAFPYWSTLNLTASGGTVIGDTNVIPNVTGANTLNFVAGSGITLTGTDSSNTIQISAGTVNAWYNIAVANGSTAGGTGTLIPDATQDTLTFAGGTGISVSTLDVGGTLDRVVVTNTGVTQIIPGSNITITSTGASGTGAVTINSSASLPATNGVWIDTGPDPDEYRLGSNTDGPSTFTQDRFINAQTFSLQIKGTPAAGDANSILKLLSSGVGRGLRVENTNASPNGAIYATAAQLTSTDAAPTGVIYSNTSGIGSAIVGNGSATAGTTTRPAIFGKGYIGVKGSNTTAQAAGLVVGGVGVYGTSVIAGSSYGVVGSTISATDILLPAAVNTGIGVYGEAPGGVRANGVSSALYTFAGRFAINPTGSAALAPLLDLRSLNNVGDVVQLVRLANDAPTNGIGAAIVFNIASTLNTDATGNKSGRIGYKLQTVADSWSRFFVTVVAESGEQEMFAIRSSGQAELYSYTNSTAYNVTSLVNLRGQYPPQSETVTGYTSFYDYSTIAARSFNNAANQTQDKGRLDTIRTRHGQYDPATITADGTTGYAATNMSVVINRAYFSAINNIVTVHVSGNMNFSTGGASSTRNFSMPLPLPANSALLTNDVIVSITFSNYTTYSYLGNITNQGIALATQRYRINVDTTASLPPSASMPFTAIFTYKLI